MWVDNLGKNLGKNSLNSHSLNNCYVEGGSRLK